MSQSKEKSKRSFMTPIMTAAFMLSSTFSFGRRSDGERVKTRNKKLQQLLCIIGFYGMILPVIYSTAKVINESPEQSPAVQQSQQNTIQEALQAQIRGYEMVLQREPNNLTALEGLANTKMQVKDYAGAIEILQELVKQYPERSDYGAMLAEAKQKAGQP